VPFDRAATVSATFTTKIGAYTYTGGTSDRITVAQAGLSNQRRFGTPGTMRPAIRTVNDDAHPTSIGLFPFTGAYGVYAGDCTAEDPTTYGQTIPDTVNVLPGDVDKAAVLRLPPVDLMVTFGGSPLDGAHLYYTPITPDCGSTPIDMGVTGADPGNPTSAARHGRVQFPGIPWGDYTACAEYYLATAVGTIPPGWYSARQTINVRSAAGLTGGSAPTLDMRSGTSGRCP
jgi:hypothetical protein